jgi:arginyl-tRNA synthetase
LGTIAAVLNEVVADGATRAGFAGSALEACVPTKDAAHGDYQSNAAFRIAKAAGKKPRDVAEALVAALPTHPAIASASVAGPGFVNLRLSDDWIAADVARRAADPRLDAPESGAGRTVVIDYSSPNVAKRIHVGHLRSTIIGNALDRMHRFLGWRVIADNHLGDWGLQYGKLLIGWRSWRDEEAFAQDPIAELQRLYQLADEKAASDRVFLDAARSETVLLQEGEPSRLALWQRFVDVSMDEFATIYDRLGIRFDTIYGESAFRHELQPLVEELLAKGVAVESEGAIVIPLEGNDPPLLIRKGDGAALYGTTDLATLRQRIRDFAPAKILYVVDTRQQAHFRQVFQAARKMGIPADLVLVHVWFGMLRFAGGVIASTRKGQVVNLVDLLDGAAEKAFDVVTEKSPYLPEAERHEISEAVGTGTVRYFDLSQNPQSDILFSWDKALSLDGGSAVYLQYAYARLHSILRAGGADATPPAVPVAVEHPGERTLALLVARLVEAIEVATDQHRPNLLAEHLEDLAKAVGPFYENCPVLKEGVPADVRDRRLALVYAVASALRVGLDLLGIRTIPRM